MRPDWRWGSRSLHELRECDPRLQELLSAALTVSPIDITIIEGHRPVSRQLEMYDRGMTRVKNSLHNQRPSMAIDIAPYPIDWDRVERFYLLGGVVLATAKQLELRIRWGGDWDGDGDLYDQTFIDLVHFELT